MGALPFLLTWISVSNMRKGVTRVKSTLGKSEKGSKSVFVMGLWQTCFGVLLYIRNTFRTFLFFTSFHLDARIDCDLVVKGHCDLTKHVSGRTIRIRLLIVNILQRGPIEWWSDVDATQRLQPQGANYLYIFSFSWTPFLKRCCNRYQMPTLSALWRRFLKYTVSGSIDRVHPFFQALFFN